MKTKNYIKSLATALKSPNIYGALIPTFFISVVFSRALYIDLMCRDFDRIGLLAAGVLTVMIAITALLFARAQGGYLESSERRSFFAAEQCFGATIIFGVTFVVAAATVLFVYPHQDPAYPLGLINWLVPTIVPLLLFIYAVFKFLYGLRVAIHRKPWDQHPKKFLTRLKRRANLDVTGG